MRGAAARDFATDSQKSLERLIPHARNARTHSDEQVAQIAGSIAEFGFVNPVLVGDDGVIVAGHGRVMAARKLGLSEAPVIVLSHLSPTQRRALMIADNQIATNAGWNEEMLAAELAALKDEAFDLELLGFDDAEIDRLLADEAPEPPADPISRPGDLWICGEHRVLCGDATVLAMSRRSWRRARRHGLHRSALQRELRQLPKDKLARQEPADPQRQPRRGLRRLLYDACVNILTVTKGAVYICMSSSELDRLQKAFREAGGKWSTFVIWAKNTFTLGRSDYQRQYEPILYGWKDGADHYWCGARDQGDVWFFDKPARTICTRR
jgi:ParB-like chromosome segregation protein Spo0J